MTKRKIKVPALILERANALLLEEDMEGTVSTSEQGDDPDVVTINNAPELVQDLKETIEQLQAALAQQDALLSKLTSAPVLYANVLDVREFKEGEAEETTWQDFTVGQDVRLLTDGRLGKIASVEDLEEYGVVLVEYTDEPTSGSCFVGHPDFDGGKLDLELVHEKSKGFALVSQDNKIFEVFLPADIEVKPGDTVKVVTQTLQIIGKADPFEAGEVVPLKQILENGFVMVEINSGSRVIRLHPENIDSDNLKLGDRLVLDSSNFIAVRNLGQDEASHGVDEIPNVQWDDIGGLEDAKESLREAVELPYQHPEIFKFYAQNPPKGVLLYGPPGCGKTLLAKAVAKAIADIHNTKALGSGYIYIKGPELLNKFVGESEANIRLIFERARAHKRAHGYPAVIFIDEAEAILSRRGSGISSDVERTTVPMFLAEMDGLEETGAIVLLATNRPDMLDPAIVRDGRIDRKIAVTRPTQKTAKDILSIHLKSVPLNNGFTVDELAQLGVDSVFEDKYNIQEITVEEKKVRFNMQHILNGAMLAAVVTQAKSLAVHRDIKNGKPLGLIKEDIVGAVQRLHKENMGLPHEEAFAEFLEANGVDSKHAADHRRTMTIRHEVLHAHVEAERRQGGPPPKPDPTKLN